MYVKLIKTRGKDINQKIFQFAKSLISKATVLHYFSTMFYGQFLGETKQTILAALIRKATMCEELRLALQLSSHLKCF